MREFSERGRERGKKTVRWGERKKKEERKDRKTLGSRGGNGYCGRQSNCTVAPCYRLPVWLLGRHWTGKQTNTEI